LVLRFTREERGQVEAVDTLIFAALVSISVVLIATYGVGSYHQDLHMQALEHRYTADFSQSFVMTSRYVSAAEGDVDYTIGPQITGDESAFSSLSNIVNKSIGKSPLDRKIEGSILDIIAEDLYLGLAYYSDDKSYPLNKWFLTEEFHENVNDFVVKNMDFLSGGVFYYRLEASYYPYEGTDLEDFLKSEAVYTNTDAMPNASVYITEVIVAIPAASENTKGEFVMSTFSEKMDGSLRELLPKDVNVSGTPKKVTEVMGNITKFQDELSDPPKIKKTGKVVIKIWSKVGGGSAEQAL
jgi:hypothetical protein